MTIKYLKSCIKKEIKDIKKREHTDRSTKDMMIMAYEHFIAFIEEKEAEFKLKELESKNECKG